MVSYAITVPYSLLYIVPCIILCTLLDILGVGVSCALVGGVMCAPLDIGMCPIYGLFIGSGTGSLDPSGAWKEFRLLRPDECCQLALAFGIFFPTVSKVIMRDVDLSRTQYHLKTHYKWHRYGIIGWRTYAYAKAGSTVPLIIFFACLKFWTKCVEWAPKCMYVSYLGSNFNTREYFKWIFSIAEPWIDIANVIGCSNGMGEKIFLNDLRPSSLSMKYESPCLIL